MKPAERQDAILACHALAAAAHSRQRAYWLALARRHEQKHHPPRKGRHP